MLNRGFEAEIGRELLAAAASVDKADHDGILGFLVFAKQYR